jgi:hypothetical protein
VKVQVNPFGKSESQASKGEEGNSSRKRDNFYMLVLGEQERSWVLGKITNHVVLEGKPLLGYVYVGIMVVCL